MKTLAAYDLRATCLRGCGEMGSCHPNLGGTLSEAIALLRRVVAEDGLVDGVEDFLARMPEPENAPERGG